MKHEPWGLANGEFSVNNSFDDDKDNLKKFFLINLSIIIGG